MPDRVMRTGVARCCQLGAHRHRRRPGTRVSNGSSASAAWACCARHVVPQPTVTCTLARRWRRRTGPHAEQRSYIVIGTHASRGTSSRPTNSGAMTPTTTSGTPVDLELAADHRGIAIEQARPGLIRQHRDRFAAGRARIACHQAAAERDAGAEALEVVARHEADRHLPAARRDGPPRLGDRAVEQIRPAAEVFVVAPAKGRAAGFLRAPPDRVQAVRIVDGERPQHVGVEDREDDRARAPCRPRASARCWRRRRGCASARATRSGDPARTARTA